MPERCRKGDLWQLGEHRLYIGDALEEESYSILLGEDRADMVPSADPPYNASTGGAKYREAHGCARAMKIEGNVADSNATTRAKFKEFAFTSGEMNPQEFIAFLQKSLGNMADHAKDGSIHYVCMDWRHTKSPKAGRSGMGNCRPQVKGYIRSSKMSACTLPPIRGLRCISPSMAQE